MDRRYKLMAEKKSKNIDTYNRKVKRVGGELIAHIVVVVRELADLMVDKRDDIENYISKLTKSFSRQGNSNCNFKLFCRL